MQGRVLGILHMSSLTLTTTLQAGYDPYFILNNLNISEILSHFYIPQQVAKDLNSSLHLLMQKRCLHILRG